uniref:Histidine-rich glycoprotein n=1 Tax=Schistosoma japonicum TaxID=6182 RepID=C1LSR9_SCHJA|nr:Histidine-rich glycoprotein precursor [Schistosoma japonicum]
MRCIILLLLSVLLFEYHLAEQLQVNSTDGYLLTTNGGNEDDKLEETDMTTESTNTNTTEVSDVGLNSTESKLLHGHHHGHHGCCHYHRHHGCHHHHHHGHHYHHGHHHHGHHHCCGHHRHHGCHHHHHHRHHGCHHHNGHHHHY